DAEDGSGRRDLHIALLGNGCGDETGSAAYHANGGGAALARPVDELVNDEGGAGRQTERRLVIERDAKRPARSGREPVALLDRIAFLQGRLRGAGARDTCRLRDARDAADRGAPCCRLRTLLRSRLLRLCCRFADRRRKRIGLRELTL